MSINNITLAPWPSEHTPDEGVKSWGYIELRAILSECPWKRVSHGNVIPSGVSQFQEG